MPAVENNTIVSRVPKAEQMQQFWQNEDFNYTDTPPQKDDIFSELLQAFFRWLEDIFGKGHVDDAWFYIKFIIVTIVVYIVITKIFKIGLFNVFSKSNKRAANTVKLNDWQDDIHTIDFDKKINAAIKKENYREAVRLHFLKILKLLTDKDLIIWSQEKTNKEYLLELSNKDLKNLFKETVIIFDFVWYGEISINDKTEFERFVTPFSALEKHLEK